LTVGTQLGPRLGRLPCKIPVEFDGSTRVRTKKDVVTENRRDQLT